MTIAYKACSTCKESKQYPIEFRKNRNQCLACTEIWKKEYLARTKERRSRQDKEYYRKNILKEKQYNLENKERISAYRKEYNKRNKEKMSAQKAKRIADDPVYKKKLNAKHQINRCNKVGIKIINPEISTDAVLERDGYICQLCFQPIDPGIKFPSGLCGVMDHIIPVHHKGDHSWENVQAAHQCCNVGKGNRTRHQRPLDCSCLLDCANSQTGVSGG